MTNEKEEEDDPPIEFFPEPIKADSMEVDDDGNLHIGIKMDDDEAKEFFERMEQFQKLLDAKNKGKPIEFLESDDKNPTTDGILE